jgi:FMN phosphatase YigB (HAD superfamily)
MFKIKRLLQATLLLVYICAGHTADALRLTPANTLIATDLDDVILKSNRTQRPPNAHLYLWHSDWKSIFKGWPNFKRINGERKYVEWMKKGLTKPAEFVRSIAQQKEIIPETLELYKKLHAQGFPFYTATNIGSIFFSDLQKRFPDLFNDNFIKHSMTVDYSVKDPIEKPDLRYFEMLKTKINPADEKYILFIDDKKENVEAARKAGLLAIQFDNAKQLAEDLKNLYGIIL